MGNWGWNSHRFNVTWSHESRFIHICCLQVTVSVAQSAHMLLCIAVRLLFHNTCEYYCIISCQSMKSKTGWWSLRLLVYRCFTCSRPRSPGSECTLCTSQASMGWRTCQHWRSCTKPLSCTTFTNATRRIASMWVHSASHVCLCLCLCRAIMCVYIITHLLLLCLHEWGF